MEKPVIDKTSVKTLLDERFIKVYDLQYAAGKHYFDASRRSAEDLVCVKADCEFREMLPDAVSCCVVLCLPGEPPRLLLSYEYRYPCGRFLLSPPAGLLDPADRAEAEPLITCAKREIFEETGLAASPDDRFSVVNPCLFSSPGMTDECNALVCAVLHPDSLGSLTQAGAEGAELFDGFVLADEAEARQLLLSGRDAQGIYYSVFTWIVLSWFVSGLWKPLASN